MYQVKEQLFGAYRQYIIENPESGNGFSIVPEIGGTITDIRIKGASILDGYTTPEELEEGKWGKCAILFPFPNRMRDGAYFWQGETRHFPINNAATSNAIHGFVRHRAFECTDTSTGLHSGSCSIRLRYDGDLPYYPFPFTLELCFSINDDGYFDTTVTVKNHYHTAIPVGFGWHPYFRLTPQVEDTTLQLPPCEKITIDDRMLPDGSREPYTAFARDQRLDDTRLDNCFTAEKDYIVRITGGGRSLSMVASGNTFPYFQVFTPPARQSVAIEPMTCNVDAFNNGNGLISLDAGAHWQGKFTFVTF